LPFKDTSHYVIPLKIATPYELINSNSNTAAHDQVTEKIPNLCLARIFKNLQICNKKYNRDNNNNNRDLCIFLFTEAYKHTKTAG